MALAISLVLFSFLMAVISYYGYRTYVRPARFYEELGTQAATGAWAGDRGAEPNQTVRILKQVGDKMPVSPRDAGLSRRILIAAGFRSDYAVPVYFALRFVIAAAFILAALVFRLYVTTSFVLGLAFLGAAGAAGYFGPSLWLDHMVDARRERLRFALPDALDLLVVGVEAGLGLDQALQTVARELRAAHPDLAEELQNVHLEMRAGTARADALRNLGRRTGERTIKQLVSIMVQSDRFGTSMAEALRTHSDFMRVKRGQEAEERANKVGVKLVFPIFFFILPSMLVVAAGSGVLQIVKHLLPLMDSYNGGI